MIVRAGLESFSRAAGRGLLIAAFLSPAAHAANRPQTVGGPITVATSTFNSSGGYALSGPATAVAEDGSFVTVWSRTYQDLYKSTANLYAQRFDASGHPIGTAVQVNQTLGTPGSYLRSGIDTVTTDANGNFMVVFDQTTDNLYQVGATKARLFTADGTPRGGEFCVDPGCALITQLHQSAMAADGTSVHAYQTPVDSASGKSSIVFRRFDANGSALDAQPVTVVSGKSLSGTIIAMNRSNGNFVVDWMDASQVGISLAWTFESVHARRYNAAGQPQGLTLNPASCTGFFALGVFKSGCQMNFPLMNMDAAGTLSFVWFQVGPATPTGHTSVTYLRRYNANGTANGSKVAINTLDNVPYEAAEAGNGDFLIDWSDDTGQDYSAAGAPIGSAFALPGDGSIQYGLATNPAGAAIGSSVLSTTNKNGSTTTTVEVKGYSIP